MKRVLLALVWIAAMFALPGCNSVDVLHTATAAGSYNGLSQNYSAAHDAVERVCTTMPAPQCADLRLNLGVIENIKMSIDMLKSKDQKSLEKILTVSNIKVYYEQGKVAWTNIRNLITQYGHPSPADMITLQQYDAQGKMLATSIDALLASAETQHPDYVQMLNQISQLVGLSLQTAAMFGA